MPGAAAFSAQGGLLLYEAKHKHSAAFRWNTRQPAAPITLWDVFLFYQCNLWGFQVTFPRDELQNNPLLFPQAFVMWSDA